MISAARVLGTAHDPLPAQPQNGMGVAGFVCGLVGLLFSFIPIIGIIAWPLVIIGLVVCFIWLIAASS